MSTNAIGQLHQAPAPAPATWRTPALSEIAIREKTLSLSVEGLLHDEGQIRLHQVQLIQEVIKGLADPLAPGPPSEESNQDSGSEPSSGSDMKPAKSVHSTSGGTVLNDGTTRATGA